MEVIIASSKHEQCIVFLGEEKYRETWQMQPATNIEIRYWDNQHLSRKLDNHNQHGTIMKHVYRLNM